MSCIDFLQLQRNQPTQIAVYCLKFFSCVENEIDVHPIQALGTRFFVYYNVHRDYNYSVLHEIDAKYWIHHYDFTIPPLKQQLYARKPYFSHRHLFKSWCNGCRTLAEPLSLLDVQWCLLLRLWLHRLSLGGDSCWCMLQLLAFSAHLGIRVKLALSRVMFMCKWPRLWSQSQSRWMLWAFIT